MPIARHGAIELAYETFGAAEGEPLLLISGTGVQMLMWPDVRGGPGRPRVLRNPL
jgi:hypothetical protein